MIKSISLFGFIALFLFSSCKKEVKGCKDSTATNYNSKATEDDGSCIYKNKEVYNFNFFAWNNPSNASPGQCYLNYIVVINNDTLDGNLSSYTCQYGSEQISENYYSTGILPTNGLKWSTNDTDYEIKILDGTSKNLLYNFNLNTETGNMSENYNENLLNTMFPNGWDNAIGFPPCWQLNTNFYFVFGLVKY